MTNYIFMKAYIFLILVLAVFLTTSFHFLENGNLKITITNIKNSNGEIDINLFKTAQGFPNEGAKAFKHLRGKITNGSCNVSFDDIPYGTYAVSMYHDENNDKKMNQSWYGKPLEGVAVSNNAKGSITGPPSFEEAKFEFNSKTGVLKIVLFNF
jgi:uncharacterized protein (DUF2141 family)